MTAAQEAALHDARASCRESGAQGANNGNRKRRRSKGQDKAKDKGKAKGKDQDKGKDKDKGKDQNKGEDKAPATKAKPAAASPGWKPPGPQKGKVYKKTLRDRVYSGSTTRSSGKVWPRACRQNEQQN